MAPSIHAPFSSFVPPRPCCTLPMIRSLGTSRNTSPPRRRVASRRGRGSVASCSSPPGIQTSGGSDPPTLLYYPRLEHAHKWEAALKGADADMRLCVFDPEDDDANAGIPWDEIEFAVVWKPPAGLLDRCPNLKAVQLTGAGVDSVLSGGLLPESVPVARIVDPVMAQSMGTYVLAAVMNIHRKTADYLEAQQRCEWTPLLVYEEKVLPSEVRVGIMGLGEMAREPARMLSAIGYSVSGWTRSKAREMEGVGAVFVGEAELGTFLSGLDVLVCLLPLTPATRGIINAGLMYQLPRGAAIINVARKAHLVAADLLAALDDGQISRAVLDVVEPEPLPPESPLWSHPRVRLTPHVSAKTNIETSVPQILENRRRALKGALPLQNQVDMEAGY